MRRYRSAASDSARWEGQMRRLAGVLDVDVSDENWGELVAAADFESMKRNAATTAPGLTPDHWIDPERGRAVIDETDMPRSFDRVGELVEPDLAAWAHGGGLATS